MFNEMNLIFVVFHVISPKIPLTHLICSADLISDHKYVCSLNLLFNVSWLYLICSE